MHVCYFDVFKESGGRSHRTFSTANPEPKTRVLPVILADARSRGQSARVRVIAEDWWLGWAMEYLGPSAPRIEVLIGHGDKPDESRTFEKLKRGSYIVDFAGRKLDAVIRGRFPQDMLQSWDIPGNNGQPLIRIYRARDP